MKKAILLVALPLFVAVLVQCAMSQQRWPDQEKRTEDRMFALQQRIGNGLASDEISANEAQNFLSKLESIRKDYLILRERRTSQYEWEPILGRLDALEKDVDRVRVEPSRIDETRIEDRMIAIQRRLDEGIAAGRVTRAQGREFQLSLDSIRREFFQKIKDRPYTSEEKRDISSRLDSLEREINRA